MSSVDDVVAVLEGEGFERLPKPLTVVGTEFDFEAAARGTNTSHDLVIVATDKVSPARLQRLVAGLARSLDLVASRRPVSLVLLGAVEPSTRTELERYARVLTVPSVQPDLEEIRSAVAVLLPLELPNADIVHGGDSINEVMAVLGPMTTPEHIALVRAAADGIHAVTEEFRQYVNRGVGWLDEEREVE